MERQADIPPIIEPPRRTNQPALVLAFVIGAILVALLSGYLGIGLPQCSFKRMTGYPCAFCGGTRSLRAIGHLHFAEAFWLNPLVTLSAFAAVIAAIFRTLMPERFDRVIFWLKKLPLIGIGLTLVALNWIFVVKFLPR